MYLWNLDCFSSAKQRKEDGFRTYACVICRVIDTVSLPHERYWKTSKRYINSSYLFDAIAGNQIYVCPASVFRINLCNHSS